MFREKVKWAVELGEFDLEYLPRIAIKGQVMADFIAEFTNFPKEMKKLRTDSWIIHVDRSANKLRWVSKQPIIKRSTRLYWRAWRSPLN